MSQLKIDSEVATDNDKEEFLEILRTGIVNKEMKSEYTCNFRFFQNNIDEFLSKYPTYFAYLPTRIMNTVFSFRLKLSRRIQRAYFFNA